MEFIIHNDCFNKAISEVRKGISSKTPLPILMGIKIVVNKESVILIGSNSDIIIEKRIPLMIDGVNVVEIVETGSIVIPATYLSEIVKKLPSNIHMKTNEKQLITIQSDEIITHISGLNADDYPRLPDIQHNIFVNIGSNELVELFKQTMFAASSNEMKPVLTGVHMTFSDDKLVVVATNSHRLSKREICMKMGVKASIIVPRSSLQELAKLFANSDEIKLFISNNYIVFQSKDITLYSRLIDGVYPNTTGLIPKESKTRIRLNTNQFLKGIDRACLFASEWRNNNVNLTIVEGDKLKISSLASEIGKIEETQLIRSIEGEKELNISLDGSFLMDALKIINEEEVMIHFGGSMSPILIQPVGNPSFLQLISPVRTY